MQARTPERYDDPAPAGPPAWRWLRKRTACALQRGAGLTPGAPRACTVQVVITDGGRARLASADVI